MKRLTVFDGVFWLHKDFPPVREDTVDEFVDCVKDMASRLASIENILGDDYDLDRLKEMVEADREGKVILCQIKEGSKVYIILLGRIFPFDVISATWHGENTVYEAEHGKYLRYTFNDADIGISVFLTQEEAKSALEKMKEGDK